MAYSKKVVDKFEKTLNEPAKFNVGRFNPKDIDVGTGMVGAPACGDVMRLQIEVDSENKIINGHHRYDVIKEIGMKEVSVVKLPITIENLLEKLDQKKILTV